MPRCIILRAISGAGKTTYARKLALDISGKLNHGDTVVIVSIDQFFINDAGEYKFDERKLSEAYSDCVNRFLRAVKAGKHVIVDNTNTRRWEYETFVLVAEIAKYEIEIHELLCTDLETLRKFHRRNSHGTPLYVLGQQFARWEDEPRSTIRVSTS